jgi:hypothetical protein
MVYRSILIYYIIMKMNKLKLYPKTLVNSTNRILSNRSLVTDFINIKFKNKQNTWYKNTGHRAIRGGRRVMTGKEQREY